MPNTSLPKHKHKIKGTLRQAMRKQETVESEIYDIWKVFVGEMQQPPDPRRPILGGFFKNCNALFKENSNANMQQIWDGNKYLEEKQTRVE